MLRYIIGLAILTLVLWFGFKVSSVIFSIGVWFFFKVPIGICMLTAGLTLCVTILLFPVGKWFLKKGGRMLIPG